MYVSSQIYDRIRCIYIAKYTVGIYVAKYTVLYGAHTHIWMHRIPLYIWWQPCLKYSVCRYTYCLWSTLDMSFWTSSTITRTHKPMRTHAHTHTNTHTLCRCHGTLSQSVWCSKATFPSVWTSAVWMCGASPTCSDKTNLQVGLWEERMKADACLCVYVCVRVQPCWL